MIAQAHPREMEQLVGEDPGQLSRFLGQLQIEHDLTLADECSGVDWVAVDSIGVQFATTRTQRRQKAYSDGAAFEPRKTFA